MWFEFFCAVSDVIAGMQVDCYFSGLVSQSADRFFFFFEIFKMKILDLLNFPFYKHSVFNPW